MNPENVLIVIPAYGEAESVADVVAGAVRAGFPKVLVVDDGSRDGTAGRAREAGAMVLSHIVNRGVGAAVRTGLEAARLMGFDAAVTLDGDGQHDPEELARVLAPVAEGRADIAIGARLLTRGRMPPMVRFFNAAANAVTWLLCGRWYRDSQSGFRAWSSRAMEKVEI
ncbi:MAG TPA: glycosyltransferase family 2 protein [bacterium]|nr:glycosyltransferase family 2 protein [bacterium]